ncbi:hypothetical protein ABTE21_21010, partial [Acinetobacter baumannii]
PERSRRLQDVAAGQPAQDAVDDWLPAGSDRLPGTRRCVSARLRLSRITQVNLSRRNSHDHRNL